ncbi:MAG: hypothetical protein BWY83_01507 [bacterium ADurb.Bin478]|nr:MAG: hypothetical protein BWY83_01507 [bacterium ADurb.Bin478]
MPSPHAGRKLSLGIDFIQQAVFAALAQGGGQIHGERFVGDEKIADLKGGGAGKDRKIHAAITEHVFGTFGEQVFERPFIGGQTVGPAPTQVLFFSQAQPHGGGLHLRQDHQPVLQTRPGLGDVHGMQIRRIHDDIAGQRWGVQFQQRRQTGRFGVSKGMTLFLVKVEPIYGAGGVPQIKGWLHAVDQSLQNGRQCGQHPESASVCLGKFLYELGGIKTDYFFRQRIFGKDVVFLGRRLHGSIRCAAHQMHGQHRQAGNAAGGF